MEDYDVIVVGAGPAGSAAAKAAAEKGAKTLLLEEHTKIGIPQHCSGLLYGTKSGVGAEVLATMDKRVILSEVKKRTVFSPKGKVFDIPLDGKDIWLLDRSLFDLQMAGQASDAGAEIRLNTKASGLLWDGESIAGVKTKAKSTPEIRSKVVIAADGLKSLLGGVPTWAGIVSPSKKIMSGMTWWLANVKDVEPGVLELHVGKHGGLKGWIWLERCDSFTCLADFDNYEYFEACKRGDSLLSRKMKDAWPVRVSGWAQTLFGKPLPSKVKSGLILAGAAARYYPFITCLVSGRYAGQTAADAIHAGDVSEKSLSPYNTLCESLSEPKPEIGITSFAGLSEDEQEEVFERMTKTEGVDFDSLAI